MNKAKGIDAMLRAIEKMVCVRGVWNCNAGWGVQLVLNQMQAKAHSVDVMREGYSKHGTVFAYYNT
ncbi:hypothetical protein IAI39_11625, partial [Streptococcus pseudopneumoniae]|uniref:hypothetical protein n=1 Tax=Streptococcus pseudopneumoniae TaxID=257758 RepID=UPI0018B05136